MALQNQRLATILSRSTTHNIDTNDLVVEGRRSSRQYIPTEAKQQYTLNKEKALKKKLEAANRTKHVEPEETGGGLRIKLSCGAYELFKLAAHQYYDKPQKGCRATPHNNYDIKGSCTSSVVKVETSHGRHLYTINLYHTTSLLLINGSDIESFRSKDYPRIQDMIDTSDVHLNELNKLITKAIKTSLTSGKRGKSGQVVNRHGPSSIEEEQDDVAEEQPITTPLIYLPSIDPNNNNSSYDDCPICELNSESASIECNDCNRWPHINCLGISQKTLHRHQSDSTLEFYCTNCANIANEDTMGALVSLTSNTPHRESDADPATKTNKPPFPPPQHMDGETRHIDSTPIPRIIIPNADISLNNAPVQSQHSTCSPQNAERRIPAQNHSKDSMNQRDREIERKVQVLETKISKLELENKQKSQAANTQRTYIIRLEAKIKDLEESLHIERQARNVSNHQEQHQQAPHNTAQKSDPQHQSTYDQMYSRLSRDLQSTIKLELLNIQMNTVSQTANQALFYAQQMRAQCWPGHTGYGPGNYPTYGYAPPSPPGPPVYNPHQWNYPPPPPHVPYTAPPMHPNMNQQDPSTAQPQHNTPTAAAYVNKQYTRPETNGEQNQNHQHTYRQKRRPNQRNTAPRFLKKTI